MTSKLILGAALAVAMIACTAEINEESIYGEYALIVDGVENILIISADETYTQKQIIDGKIETINRRSWKDYAPDDDDVRYSLVGFKFPTKKSSGEWHAQLATTWGKLSLCYFNDEDISECYVKRTASSP